MHVNSRLERLLVSDLLKFTIIAKFLACNFRSWSQRTVVVVSFSLCTSNKSLWLSFHGVWALFEPKCPVSKHAGTWDLRQVDYSRIKAPWTAARIPGIELHDGMSMVTQQLHIEEVEFLPVTVNLSILAVSPTEWRVCSQWHPASFPIPESWWGHVFRDM